MQRWAWQGSLLDTVHIGLWIVGEADKLALQAALQITPNHVIQVLDVPLAAALVIIGVDTNYVKQSGILPYPLQS